MAEYRTVINVPTEGGVIPQWVKDVIDDNISTGEINVTDNHKEDWNEPLTSGRRWTFEFRARGRHTPQIEPPVEPPLTFDTVLNPGDTLDLQSAGDTVLIRTGTYMGQVLTPRPSQHVTFEDGCVLDGGGRWAPGPTKSNSVTVLQTGPKSVIVGSAPNVSLIGNGLVIVGYSPASQFGAFEFRGNDFYGQDFTVQDCTAVGVMLLGDRAHSVRVAANKNAQLGWKYQDCDDGLMEDCDAYDNNEDESFNSGWEAGGSKFVRTNRLVLRGCESSRNVGPGWWTDIDNNDSQYYNCRAFDNTGPGIFHEISGTCLIDGGEFRGNGTQAGWMYYADVLIAHSGVHSETTLSHNGCEVRNVTAGNISGIQQDRDVSPRGFERKLKGLWVHHNTVMLDNPVSVHGGFKSHGIGSPDSDGLDPFSPAWNNRYDHNTYRGPDGRFEWDNGNRDWAYWQAAGNDMNGLWV